MLGYGLIQLFEIHRITGRPSGSAFFNKGGNGYNDSIKIAYEFDSNGDPGFTDSYIRYSISWFGTKIS